ncbi:hypothetical protein MtrunA17_Chr5g0431121 [Medicago truncatula]|uniref:Transmembrane protein n=1 Tax=Medicago truncatula TaxID=3880 RepID=A0A396HVL8_MEDTR|nr:hypothetical protein MtrunA17_Chr5g0431121 [Medicago truncatula]
MGRIRFVLCELISLDMPLLLVISVIDTCPTNLNFIGVRFKVSKFTLICFFSATIFSCFHNAFLWLCALISVLITKNYLDSINTFFIQFMIQVSI